MNDQQMNHPENPKAYEKKDASVRWITLVALALILVIGFFYVILNEYYIVTHEEIVQESVLAPESDTLMALLAWEDSVLSNYGKITDSNGTRYYMPIDSAIKKFVEKEASR